MFCGADMRNDDYVMNKDETIVDMETYQADVSSQDGNVQAQEDVVFEITTLACINRMKARVRSAREVMKARDRLAAETDIAKNNENGFAAQFVKENEKDIDNYQKRKEAFARLAEERKALKQK